MKEKKNIKKAGMVSGIAIGLVVAVLFMANIGNVVVDSPESVERQLMFREVWLPFLGTNDPGSGASGVMNVFVNATNTSASPYTDNLTGAYESGDVNNSHIGSDVPYSTAFDVIVQVRWNRTHAYDTDWNLSLVRAYANCTVLGVTAIQMVEANITSVNDYIYVSYFLRDSDGGAGTGFTIASGVNVTSFSVVFESYYYA